MAIPGFIPLASIPLSCERSGGPPEWALIELQGELERRDAAQPGQEFVFGQITRSALVNPAGPAVQCIALICTHCCSAVFAA